MALGASFTFEKGLRLKDRIFAPYVYRTNDSMIRTDLAAEDAYDSITRYDWFSVPKESGRNYWTQPYIDPVVKKNHGYVLCSCVSKGSVYRCNYG